MNRVKVFTAAGDEKEVWLSDGDMRAALRDDDDEHGRFLTPKNRAALEALLEVQDLSEAATRLGVKSSAGVRTHILNVWIKWKKWKEWRAERPDGSPFDAGRRGAEVAGRIKGLKQELNNAYQEILSLVPAPFQGLCSEASKSIEKWLEAVEIVLRAAVVKGDKYNARAYCPLCGQGGGYPPYGFDYPEGLKRHLRGKGSARCPAMTAAWGLAVENDKNMAKIRAVVRKYRTVAQIFKRFRLRHLTLIRGTRW